MPGKDHIDHIVLDENLSAALSKALREGADLSDPMALIANDFLRSTEQRFRDEAGPSGVPWKQSQRARKGGGKTLYKSGDLFDALSKNSGSDFAEAGVEASGGAAVYAAIHQFGGPVTPRGQKGKSFVSRLIMPARPYLGIDDDDERGVIEVLSEFVQDLFNADDAALQSGGSA